MKGELMEDTLNADVIRHFANREPLVIALTRNADNYPVLLDTLLVTFHNTVSNRMVSPLLNLGILSFVAKDLLQFN
jgi:hypothetical protein